MITIYRRAEVIAVCTRAEVRQGLKSGRFELTDHYDCAETPEWISLTHFESRRYEIAAPTPVVETETSEPTHPILALLTLPFMPFVVLFRLAGWVAEHLGTALDFTVVLSLALIVGLVIAAATGLLIFYAPAAAAILLTLYMYNRKDTPQ
jgi:hypothetical protein